MGRRGRPPKVKVAPRKPSLSRSSHESSSPDRYVFQSSVNGASRSVGDVSRVGLSWVIVLKSPPAPAQVGEKLAILGNPNLTSSSVPLSKSPVVVSCSPECRSSFPLDSVHGHGSVLKKAGHVGNSHGQPIANSGVLHSHVDENGFRAYKRPSQKNRVPVQQVPSQVVPPTIPIDPGVAHAPQVGDSHAPLI
ncbi:unnamed protein product [Amaranthus hypochondriacus]